MRQVLRSLRPDVPDHVGLAYDVWAPIATQGEDAGKVPNAERSRWLEKLRQIPLAKHYPAAFERWRNSLASETCFEIELRSRLLIGTGNPAPTEVGLTVHHTWGVPVLPGSALKGLLAHWVDATYGPEDRSRSPRDPEHPERGRAPYQGVTWNPSKGTIERGPGEVHRALFGAPAALDDPDEPTAGWGPTRGGVVFHDAWFVPGSVNQPFAPDVLTVHQKTYYGQGSAKRNKRDWPSDHDDPTPVGFLSVHPGARFWVALGGDPAWCELARELLLQALERWGIGAKTSAGYGRAGAPTGDWLPRRVDPRPGPTGNRGRGSTKSAWNAGDECVVTLVEKNHKGKWKAKLDNRRGTIEVTGETPADWQPDQQVKVTVGYWPNDMAVNAEARFCWPPRPKSEHQQHRQRRDGKRGKGGGPRGRRR